MSHTDERLRVGAYLKQSLKTVAGLAWLAVCVASIIGILDVLFGLNTIPLRDHTNPDKVFILLLFSPALVFLILVCASQLPFGANRIAEWIRDGFMFCRIFGINFPDSY